MQASFCNEVNHEFDNVSELHLTEDVYSADDVKDRIGHLKTGVNAEIRTEMEKHRSHVMLLLGQVFTQAEALDVELSIDTAALDDHQLLLGLKGLLMESQEKKPELLNISLGPKKGVLSSLGGGANDLKYAEKVKELEAVNSTLQSRFTKLHEQLKQQMKENEMLRLQQKSANDNVSRAGADAEEAAKKAVGSYEELKKKYDDAMVELTGKIQATSQFQQLKKMVQAKNEELKQLRSKIREYEGRLGIEQD